MYNYKEYDESAMVERVWYVSSNILYSECDDTKDSLKTLRVTFKNGATYEYHGVDVNDYLMFRQGGLDGSSGKAFAKYIKPKYNFVKLAKKDPSEVEKELEEAMRAKKNT